MIDQKYWSFWNFNNIQHINLLGETSAPKRSKLVDSEDENEPQEYEVVNGDTAKPLLDGESSDEGVDKNENDNNT